MMWYTSSSASRDLVRALTAPPETPSDAVKRRKSMAGREPRAGDRVADSSRSTRCAIRRCRRRSSPSASGSARRTATAARQRARAQRRRAPARRRSLRPLVAAQRGCTTGGRARTGASTAGRRSTLNNAIARAAHPLHRAPRRLRRRRGRARAVPRGAAQPAFFSTVRFSVERATGRAFTPRHLQQLLGAVPDALAVHVAKRRAAGGPGGGGGGGVSGVNF